MKLFQRITSAILGALLCCSIAFPALANRASLSPACTLGTEPSDMLSGGGRRVQVENLQYYIDDADGAVYELSNPSKPILEGPVAGLNYNNGVLYYARLRADSFALCAFELEAATERVLLDNFAGSVGQLYLVNGESLEFSSGNTVWNYSLADGALTQILTAPELWSFVPTGCGLIYASGTLFDYTLYANENLLARHVQDYTLRFDLEGGLLVYNCAGEDYQMNLSDIFSGTVEMQEFSGCFVDPTEERWEAEPWYWYVPSPGTGITRSTAGEISWSEAASRGTVSLFADDGQYRMQATEGTMNIVRRARQMLNIQWTPVDGIPGWGYTDLSYDTLIFYDAGVTYRGLPYGQGMSYVPWNTSYYGFLSAVRDINSKMYTDRCEYARGSQYFGTDCSGFTSWAWGTTVNGDTTPQRKTCGSLMDWDNTIMIGQNYSLIQVGDALVSSAHAVLVTDVTYNSDGSISSIEISQANPTTSSNGCCYSTRYTGTAALQRLNTNYFIKGSYSIYRNKIRDSVTYTHDCNVPVEGDVCDKCGVGLENVIETDSYVSVGIDVSCYQSAVKPIDWKSVATQVDYAIVRVGYTGNTTGNIYLDDTAVEHIQGCIDYDIPFGIYYYAGATTPEKAGQEADFVLSFLQENGFAPTLPVFYDVEEPNNILKLSDAKLAEVCSAFCDRVESAGFRAGVYASASVWDDNMTSDVYDSMVHWVAHWGTDTVNAKPGANVWQYSCEGSVLGITGDVDLDYWIGPLGDTEHPSKVSLTEPSGCVEGKLISSCVQCKQVMDQPVRGEGHTPGKVETKTVVEPTCTVSGTSEKTTYCSVCGAVACQILVPEAPLGHSWELDEVRAVGPTPHDSTGFYTCSRCNDTAELPLCASAIFDDMPKRSNWAHEAIDWAYFNGLFSGVSKHSFGVNMTMDRAMLVTVLYSIAGRPEVSGELPFKDVKKRAYYYNAVLWANQVGVANGTSAESFSPNDPVTREQVAVMLLGYLRSLDQDPQIDQTILGDYPDATHVSKFARIGMAWAVEEGLLSGAPVDGVNYLLPRNSATRAQVAVMFMQFTKQLQAQGLWTPPIQWTQTPAEPGDETPSAEAETPSTEVETPSMEAETPSAGDEAPSAENEAPNPEVEAPSAENEPSSPENEIRASE